MTKVTNSTNWVALIEAIMEKLVLTQSDMASELDTTQQSVSNWLNHKREPRGKFAQKILALSSVAQINVESFVSENYLNLKNIKISRRERKLLTEICALHSRSRNSILKDLNALLELYSTKNSETY